MEVFHKAYHYLQCQVIKDMQGGAWYFLEISKENSNSLNSVSEVQKKKSDVHSVDVKLKRIHGNETDYDFPSLS